MKNWHWLALICMLAVAPWAVTSPTQPIKLIHIAAPPLASQFFIVPCNAGERTSVIASGEGRAPLGLYVYDANGNCITRDEAIGARTADDLAVEWYPPAIGQYAIEVRNQGIQVNEVDVVIR